MAYALTTEPMHSTVVPIGEGGGLESLGRGAFVCQGALG